MFPPSLIGWLASAPRKNRRFYTPRSEKEIALREQLRKLRKKKSRVLDKFFNCRWELRLVKKEAELGNSRCQHIEIGLLPQIIWSGYNKIEGHSRKCLQCFSDYEKKLAKYSSTHRPFTTGKFTWRFQIYRPDRLLSKKCHFCGKAAYKKEMGCWRVCGIREFYACVSCADLAKKKRGNFNGTPFKILKKIGQVFIDPAGFRWCFRFEEEGRCPKCGCAENSLAQIKGRACGEEKDTEWLNSKLCRKCLSEYRDRYRNEKIIRLFEWKGIKFRARFMDRQQACGRCFNLPPKFTLLWCSGGLDDADYEYMELRLCLDCVNTLRKL